MIRLAKTQDLPGILELYSQLKPDESFEANEETKRVWEEILKDEKQFVIVCDQMDQIISTCTLTIIPNITRGRRPYGVIENMVTNSAHKRIGYGNQVLDYAKKIAVEHNCYKMMLMTSRTDLGTSRFYESAGFNKEDKTAFVQWLD